MAALVLVSGCRSAFVHPPPSQSTSGVEELEGAASEASPSEIEGEALVTALPPDGIPAIDEPEFITADEADAFMDPDETVLGVVGADGTAKCYSAWQLDGHEIVNDVLDGQPITATW